MELLNIISNVNNNPFVSIETITEVKMNKRNNPFYGRVTKHYSGVVQIGYSYQNSVNNRLEKIGIERDFVADSLPWGEWVKGLENKVLTHKGEYYLRVYEVNNPQQKPTITILLDGNEVDAITLKEIQKYIIQKTASAKQTNMGLADEQQTKPRAIKFSNVIKLKCGNFCYNM